MNENTADAALIAKLARGRPVPLSDEEVRQMTEALRAAVALVLDCPVEKITDGARIFDDLGLDSIDVFDVLDQLATRFEVQVELEQLPPELIRGADRMTFAQFAQGILAYFCSEPAR
jgi:acyl carrier protein